MGGGQLDDSSLFSNPNVSAIVWDGYPGQDGGTALIDIITGKAAPAGRLPITRYPTNYIQEVAMTDMNLRPGPNNPGRTYKWFPNPVVEFGFGVHYTNFTASFANKSLSSTYAISDLGSSCSNSTSKYLDLCPFTTVPISVTNTGTSKTSDFVALLFVSGSHGPQPYPIKSLVAYQRLYSIAPGASQTAMLNLTMGSFARVDDNGNSVLYPSDYSLLVDVPTPAVVNFTLTGSQAMLDQWPQRPAQG